MWLLGLLLATGATATCPWESEELLPWSSLSTWSDSAPSDGSHIRLTTPVLLDTDTPRLRRLDIYSGGRLVFSPNSSVSLTSDSIRVGNGGSLEVGSEECSYPGQASISLTGQPGMDDCMGDCPKGLFVDAGGSLEMHGQEKLSWTQLTRTLQPGAGPHELQLEEPGFGWQTGDRLVIASTDYDTDQAEEVVVEFCEENTCIVSGDIRYEHFGEFYKGVDMRAEVGLLSRNIKVSGEVLSESDTYGGHIKAWEGFKTFKIKGVELTHMGQQGIKGRYPIHWHMAGWIDPVTTYAANNSLHHNFQRCITVHGTHGVTVSNNVAYDTMGHCYFLEDGGEKNNTLYRNLGLGVRPGTTIPSDRKPSIFWVTSPLNNLIENHAAGSTHMGIWYIFGENVTGPSADLGLFQHMEAFKTAILKNEDNVVHSCGETGFMFGGALQHDQDFSEHTALCDPRITPLDPDSPPAVNYVTRMTVFKNVKENIWNDCRATKWTNLHSSDAYLGLTMAHNNWVIDSTFIGESSNWGEPNRVLLRNGSKVMWHRSTPDFAGDAHHHHAHYIGLQLYDGNPHAEGTHFADFVDDAYKLAGAIGYRKPNAGMSPTIFLETSFDYEDNVGGNYVLGRPSGEGHGTDRRGILFDWDGTITGTPMASVVKDEPFTTSSLCTPHPNWGNMSVCPHRFSESGGSGDSYNKFDVVVTRDDIPEFPKVAMVNGEAWHLFLSVDHSYIYSFRNRSLPKAFVFISKGLDSGHSQLVGFCTPLGVPEEEIKFLGDYPRPVQVDSYVELLQDETGTAYFWDEEVGVVFRKFKVFEPRTPQTETACVGENGQCPSFRIETIHPGDTDCTDRAYPKYQKPPI